MRYIDKNKFFLMKYKYTISDIWDNLLKNEKNPYNLVHSLPIYLEIILKNIVDICYSKLRGDLYVDFDKNVKKISSSEPYQQFTTGKLEKLWTAINIPEKWKKYIFEEDTLYNFPIKSFNIDYRIDTLHHGFDPGPILVKKYYDEIIILLESVFPRKLYLKTPITLNNLPSKDIEFIGRDNEKKTLIDFLRNPRKPMWCVYGFGGIGKTALVREVASHCLDNNNIDSDLRFDAIVWTTAKRKEFIGRPVNRHTYISNLEGIYSEILRVVEPYQYNNKPLAEDLEKNVYEIVKTRKVLLIVDNMETIDDEKVITFCNDLPNQSKAIITSRGTANIDYSTQLKKLPLEESIKLIQSNSSNLGLKMEINEIKELAKYTDGNPLCIKYSLGLIKEKGFGVKDVKDVISKGDSDSILEYILGYSVEILSENSKAIMEALSIVDADENEYNAAIQGKMIGDWLDLGDFDLREALSELIGLSLISVVEDPTYNNFISSELVKKRFGLNQQAKDYINNKIIKNNSKFFSFRENICNKIFLRISKDISDPDWSSIKTINLIEEFLHLTTWCLYDAYERNDYDFVIKMQRIIDYTLGIRGHNDIRLKLGYIALESARKIGDFYNEVRIEIMCLGWLYFISYKFDEALNFLTNGLDIAQKNNYKDFEGLALRTIGQVHKEKEEFEKAEVFIQKSIDVFGEINNERLLTLAYSAKSSLYRDMKKNNEAESLIIKAYDICKDIENFEEVKSIVLQKMTKIAINNEDYSNAEIYNKEAENISIKLKRQIGIAYCKLNTALILDRKGNLEEAVKTAIDAKNLFLQFGNKNDIKIELTKILEKAENAGIIITKEN